MRFVVSTVLLVTIFFASDIIKSGKTLTNKNLSHKVNKDIGSYVAGGEHIITTKKYPYYCLIIWSDTHRCHGALINKYWVIGHCWGQYMSFNISIAFGESNFTWKAEDYGSLYNIPHLNKFGHPGPSNGFINLYKLPREAPVSSTVIALPKRDLLTTPMEYIEVLVLYANEVHHCVTASYKRCFDEVNSEDSVYCFRCHENLDTAQKLNGGIIVYRDKDADSSHILFGLRYDHKMLANTRYDKFTNVANHLDWINAVTGIPVD